MMDEAKWFRNVVGEREREIGRLVTRQAHELQPRCRGPRPTFWLGASANWLERRQRILRLYPMSECFVWRG